MGHVNRKVLIFFIFSFSEINMGYVEWGMSCRIELYVVITECVFQDKPEGQD